VATDHEVRSRGRSTDRPGPSTGRAGRRISGRADRPLTGRADRRRTERDSGPRNVRLARSNQTGAGPRRSRSGSIAVEPPLPRRHGTGTHREPSVPVGRRVLLAAMQSGLAAMQSGLAAMQSGLVARRPGLGARRAARAAKLAIPVAGPATLRRALPGTGAAPRAASGPIVQTGRPGPLRLRRVGRRRLVGAVWPATAWASWITRNRPRLRSGQEFARALNQHVVVGRPAPEPAGRRGGRLAVAIRAVPGPTVQRPPPSQPAEWRLAVRRSPVLGPRSHRLRARFHQNWSWKGKRATRTVAVTTGR
jgi:hypothetical protein